MFWASKPEAEVLSKLSSYVAKLDAPVAAGHRRMATAVTQMRAAGWDTKIAIATYRLPSGDEERPSQLRSVYATSDGLAIWPHGVKLPFELLPLTRFAGVDSARAASLSGWDNPAEKLRRLVPDVWKAPLSVITSDDLDEGDVSDIIAAGDAAVPTTLRDHYSGMRKERFDAAVTSGILLYGRPELPEATVALQELMWKDAKPEGYDMAMRRYLFADALTYMSVNHDEASYSLEDLVEGPSVELAPR